MTSPTAAYEPLASRDTIAALATNTTPHIIDPLNLPPVSFVPLADLIARPKEFSPRLNAIDEAHLNELVKVLANGVALDPITVVRSGRRLLVIDGFHRHAAYQKARWTAPVAVRVYEGGPLNVMCLAISENAKSRLPLTSTERTNWAWKFVQAEQAAKLDHKQGQQADKLMVTLSKAKIAELAGVSHGLVASMRTVWQQWVEQSTDILDDAQSWQLSGDWAKDRRAANGNDTRDWSEAQQASWREERIERLAREVRSLSTVAATDAAAVAEVLRRVLGRHAPVVGAALAAPITTTTK